MNKLKHFGDAFRGNSNPSGENARESYYKKDSVDFICLIRSWKDIVGDLLTKHTVPLKLSNNVLVVLARHSAYAQELSYMSEMLKAKIFERYPSLRPELKSVQFIASERYFLERDQEEKDNKTPNIFSEEFIKREKTKKHEHSPEYLKIKSSLREELEGIDDPELRELLISLKIQKCT